MPACHFNRVFYISDTERSIAFFRDPDGNEMSLWQYLSSAGTIRTIHAAEATA
jgi:hypothetical protein